MDLLFIHGSGSCKEAWLHQTNHFKNGHAVNLPGHPVGNSYDRIDDYAIWLNQHIESRNYEPLVLVGHSMGGGIAMQYALEHPERLSGLVITGSGGKLRVLPEILQLFNDAMSNLALMEDYKATAFNNIGIELTEILKRRTDENGPEAHFNDFSACDNFDMLSQLPEVNVPLLAVVGSEDTLTPPKYARHLAEAVTNGRCEVIEGAGHFAFAEQPVAFNDIVNKFVDNLAVSQ